VTGGAESVGLCLEHGSSVRACRPVCRLPAGAGVSAPELHGQRAPQGKGGHAQSWPFSLDRDRRLAGRSGLQGYAQEAIGPRLGSSIRESGTRLFPARAPPACTPRRREHAELEGGSAPIVRVVDAESIGGRLEWRAEVPLGSQLAASPCPFEPILRTTSTILQQERGGTPSGGLATGYDRCGMDAASAAVTPITGAQVSVIRAGRAAGVEPAGR